MIDLQHERVLSLSAAAACLPRRRAGRKPALATLYRWASHGLRGIRLETIQVGGTMCTSLEALQRFFDELGTARTGRATPSSVPDDDADASELDAAKW